MTEAGPLRLAVLCRHDGEVLEQIVNDSGRQFARFEDLFVPECHDKARAFVRELASNRSSFGWELNLEIEPGIRSLQFGGSASAEELLIVGGRSAAELVALYTALHDSEDERLATFREHLRRDIAARAAAESRYSELYDALSSANNDLANSQRELARQTIQLERANVEREEALLQLLKLKEALEVRVIERTRQLQETNAELEAFSYSVSHDLRAPLRHISGFADLLLRSGTENLSEAQRRYVQVISESTKEAGMLVDDLLSFARMGRAEMMHADVDLNAIVEGVIGEFAAESAERRITWNVQRDLPVVLADRAMLRLVVRNLVSNAVKYTARSEHPEVTVGYVRASSLPPDGIPEDQRPADDDLVVYVRDNGVGFDMQYVGKLFGVFQRLHRPEDFAGTGIGLANVKRIIRRHGGRTWAIGAVDEGATVYFSLPANLEVK